MALYDNKYWLLSHIRNSFISTDDTGTCEVVMAGESKLVKEYFFSKEPFRDPDESEKDDSDDEEEDTGSYGLRMDSDFGIRDGLITSTRAEKSDNSIRKTNKTKHIKWETRTNKNIDNTNEDLVDTVTNSLFIKKEINTQDIIKSKSGLTDIIERTQHLPENPYKEYTKFDGAGQVMLLYRNYRIFLMMLPEEERNFPIEVCCVATATVQQLIGLTLLKYSLKNPEVMLKPVENYRLYITEEDCDIAIEFPFLDLNLTVGRFGFTCLALVEYTAPSTSEMSISTQSVPLSPDSESSSGKKRTTSTSKAEETKQIKNDMMIMDGHNKAMEAPLYKSYRVSTVNKLKWWNVDVHLGISSEKIEIDSLSQKSSKFYLAKQAPISHSMDTIAWCEQMDRKGHKSTFRIVYTPNFEGRNIDKLNSYSKTSTIQFSPSFKQYVFEAEIDVTEEIVNKINMILNLRSSHSRREYLAAKEKKHLTRKKKN